MNILVIEDDQAIRETLKDLLEFSGHSVSTAPDGVEGIKLAEDGPDLILCDIAMPGMDGYQVITAIRQSEQCRDIPFIFLTGRADRPDQRRGMVLGADDYITKPFTQRDILDAVEARVRRQQPLRERIEHLLAEHRFVVDASWSHELMTPLTSVLGGLEMIEEEAEKIQPEELKQLLRLIRAGAERQLNLSRKLVLHFELERMRSIRAAKQDSCDGPTAILAGAGRAAQDMNRDKDLIVQCAPATLPVLSVHLDRAVAELVDNALRFSKPGQPVTVTGTRQEMRYLIVIADQGGGMTEEQCADIGPFVQFERGKREQQGLGLGLAIARAMAEISGGRLSLAAGPGGSGLQVTLDLPCL